jgi:8-oxo-dGTP pyrophosphatase MutT (NUDIX family)
MPYAYAVVWCNNGATRNVLLAQKRFLGTRFGGVAAPIAQLLNGAGQNCFPGGVINPGEADAAAAYREFLEETGIDLQQPAAIGLYHVIHAHVIAHAPAQPFSTLYVQVAAAADLAALAADINLNIAGNVPVDEEHLNVAVVAEANVLAALGPNPAIPGGPQGWYTPARMAQLALPFRFTPVVGAATNVPGAPTFVLPHVRAQVTARLNDPFNWHQLSINNLPVAAAAAGAAAAAMAAAALAAAGPVAVPVLAPVGGPAIIAPPGLVAPAWNLGFSRRQAMLLASVLAVGLAVTINQLMPYLYPQDNGK